MMNFRIFFFFSSGRRHTRFSRDWSSDVALPIYAVTGFSRAGYTSFTNPFALKLGVAPFHLIAPTETRVRWGDYSATTLDPSSHAGMTSFWRSEERRVGKE